ncbi:hypothetical protein E2C01_035143 [Portunus trituberculatus]|uniref:Uncharacterized protein n=1 Tax=Portunus trituberculatus TaxID=210409 RepID=A0A5B7FAN3_PORTR|nr:hypothetical protein [Portunus trituberculatus]
MTNNSNSIKTSRCKAKLKSCPDKQARLSGSRLSGQILPGLLVNVVYTTKLMNWQDWTMQDVNCFTMTWNVRGKPAMHSLYEFISGMVEAPATGHHLDNFAQQRLGCELPGSIGILMSLEPLGHLFPYMLFHFGGVKDSFCPKHPHQVSHAHLQHNTDIEIMYAYPINWAYLFPSSITASHHSTSGKPDGPLFNSRCSN